MAPSASLVLIALTISVIISTVTSESLEQDQLDLPLLQKRPFCNAFTGCGRKRSNQRENRDIQFSNRQNRLYALIQQKLAEIQALKGLLDEDNPLRCLREIQRNIENRKCLISNEQEIKEKQRRRMVFMIHASPYQVPISSM